MSQFSRAGLDSLLIILGFLLTALFGYGHFIDGDVVQILDKAHLYITQGVLLPYGNVSSSGASGNIPGSFLTLSSALPMSVWSSPWAPLAFLAILHFFAYLMYRNVLKHFIAPQSLIVVVVIFWLNPWRLSEVFLWNPGYIYFAAVMHFWSAYHLSYQRSFIFSIVHGLSLFLGLQIHPSFIILFFMTMMLLWLKAMRPHLIGTLCGIVIGLATLIPYFLAGLEDPSVFPQPGGGDGNGFLFFGLIYVYPLLKGFWYWILYGSSIFQTHVFHQVQFDWLGGGLSSTIVKSIWTVIKYGLGALGVIISFRVNYRFYKKYRNRFKLFKFKMMDPGQWLSIYTITAFYAALMATALSTTLPIYWHLLYVWPMALIPLIMAFDRWLQNSQSHQRAKTYLAVLTVYFCLTNLLAAIDSKKHDITQPFPDLYQKACLERCAVENLSR